jgi:GT2 family glycosyltransferase
MPDIPRVASIVLSYNNFVDTHECLCSLAGIAYPAHEIVVVDNGSTDDSATRLRREWEGKVRFVLTGQNVGGAAGWNAGIHAAWATADYFLILNNDIVVDPGLVERLLVAFAGGPDTALVSPVIVSYDQPDSVWYAGGRYNDLFGISTHARLGASWESLGPKFGALVATDYAPLCAALISKAVLEKVGLFDESFFFGHEDVDWCMRARDAGLRCRVAGQPLVRHKVSASGGSRGSLAFTRFSAFHFAAGSVKLGRKRNHGLRLVPFVVGQLFLRLPVYGFRMVAAGRPGALVSYLAGLVAGIRADLRPLPLSSIPGSRSGSDSGSTANQR